eukprot:TRINITY_DN9107_c0_g1_i1.p1 TRINITY_DN9107_c0_g1~~TRINITY_DN9107_c0_g1_i1.p1  ORF type:complete len:228 (-),score=31.48 TRINITY_DN9107_c0_g1_i1:191-874(-)
MHLDSYQSTNPLTFKLLVIGDKRVGKTSLIDSFINAKPRSEKNFQNLTINSSRAVHPTSLPAISPISSPTEGRGIDIRSRKIEVKKRIMTLLVVDPDNKFTTSNYYRGVNGVLLVFDVTDYLTFNNLELWIHQVERYGQDNVVIVIVGNKIDQNKTRSVSQIEAQSFAKKHKLQYIETSAKESINVEEAFRACVEPIYIQKNVAVTTESTKIHINIDCCNVSSCSLI